MVKRTQKTSPTASGHLLWTHHALYVLACSLNRGAFGGMSITEAVSSDHHVIDGVVILLLDLHSRVQQVVSKRVQFGKLNTQVGDLQQV